MTHAWLVEKKRCGIVLRAGGASSLYFSRRKENAQETVINNKYYEANMQPTFHQVFGVLKGYPRHF